MKPDQYTTLKPYKTSLKDTPKVGGLKEKDGWVNMQVQFLINQKICNSDKLLVGWTVLPPGGLIAGDPGPAGLWLARAFRTVEPGSVIVPAAFVRGFAAAATLVASLSGRVAIGVTTEPKDSATEAIVDLATSWSRPLVLEIWGGDESMTTVGDHARRLRDALAQPGVQCLDVPVDFAETRRIIEVAGEVVAWHSDDGSG